MSRGSRFVFVMAVLAASAVLVAALAASVGTTHVRLADVVKAVAGRDVPPGINAIVSLRVSRVALACIVGVALSCAGVALQALLRNPLADPYILGVSGGGALAAALYLTCASELVAAARSRLPGLSGLAVSAFAGALAASGVVLLAGRRKGHILPGTLLLVGVMVNALAGAAVLALTFLSSPANGRSTIVWLMGNLGGVGLSGKALATSAVATLALVVLLWRLGARLNLMTLGDEAAAALGVNVPRTRLVAFILSALVTGLSVAVAGPVGFVGLIIPHMTRRLVGADHRMVFPAAAVLGAAFLVAADTLARTAFVALAAVSRSAQIQGGELPVGVLTAAIGAPVFIWILHSHKGRYFE